MLEAVFSLLIIGSALLSAGFWALSSRVGQSKDEGTIEEREYFDLFIQKSDEPINKIVNFMDDLINSFRKNQDSSEKAKDHLEIDTPKEFLEDILIAFWDIRLFIPGKFRAWCGKTKKTACFYDYVTGRLNKSAAIWACIAAFLVGLDKLIQLFQDNSVIVLSKASDDFVFLNLSF